MAFKVGGMAVYPSHGVARIKSTQQREISGIKVKFYVLHVMDSGARVMVPVSSSSQHMRPLMDADAVDHIFDVLSRHVDVPRRAWNRRFREFHEKLGATSTVDVAEVLRDIWALSQNKELSFGEQLIFEKAMKMMCEEIAICKGWKPEVVEQKIRATLRQASQRKRRKHISSR